MYNLDINFLKDRPEYSGASATASRGTSRRAAGGGGGASSGGGGGLNPLLIGALVGLLPLALVGLGWGFLTVTKGGNEQRLAEVKAQVAQIEQKEKERDKARADLQKAKAQITALTGVFSNIKPWSAMSQDLRDRLPAGMQISEIVQKTKAAPPPPAATAPSPSPGTAPPVAEPIGRIEISGFADSFDKVNDFLVVLQKSNFLTPEATRIVAAEKREDTKLSPISLPGPDGDASSDGPTVNAEDLPKLPAKVSFKIETELAKVSTDELLRELDRKGAVGLVSRIEALKEKGVIKP
ncbi:PilN domain-containing protein [filamentous cyanobacterium LEGE 11480]|uniref:PilN domain-containing protein n=1 Tax=Romeriopsis navalis LEGE 11480 TaxID=2777977 RepID=A0A928VSK5_9CYAN|nr:PilN domain-containing protein [Romeriopsis navalis]MBE9031329.1 PilN domain-containing protein [Romeriopsis navalis LEGE 11480]